MMIQNTDTGNREAGEIEMHVMIQNRETGDDENRETGDDVLLQLVVGGVIRVVVIFLLCSPYE